MVLFAANLANDSVCSNTGQLPADPLPDIGRVIGVHGHAAVQISVAIEG